MEHSWHQRDVMLLALTLSAGYVDVIGYLVLGGVFTANMTGNTVLLGLHLSQAQGAAVLRSTAALAGFGAGLLIGALVVERGRGSGPWPPAVTRALAVEALVLALFAVDFRLTGAARALPELHGLIILSAIAMGIQSAAVRRLDVPGIATTYMTGTLTSAVTGLVASSLAAGDPARPDGGARTGGFALRWGRAVRLQLLSLVVYGLGATIGGLGQHRWPAVVPIVPLAIVLAVVVAASVLYRSPCA